MNSLFPETETRTASYVAYLERKVAAADRLSKAVRTGVVVFLLPNKIKAEIGAAQGEYEAIEREI